MALDAGRQECGQHIDVIADFMVGGTGIEPVTPRV